MKPSHKLRGIAAAALFVGGCDVSVTTNSADPKTGSGPVQPAPAIPAAALKAAATDPAAKALYSANGWQAAWSPEAVRALDHALDTRARDGLDRVDFGATHPTDAARADVEHSRIALAYAAALSRGLIDPTSLHQHYTIPRPAPDLAAGMLAALRAGRVGAWLGGLAPQDGDYRALSQAYLGYRKAPALARPAIAAAATIHPGDRDPRIAAVAAALRSEGYLSADAAIADDHYAPPIVAAVQHLQTDYGIKPDGAIGAATLDLLNEGPDDKARALAVALERRRWLSRTPPATRIDVNTAAATLTYWRDGKPVDRRVVIAGKPDKETPPLAAPLYRLVANPTWTVPKSIKVSAATIRHDHMHRANGYLVQPAGPDNALGLVKFDMKDDQAIYLHDTSDHGLFDRVQRHLSHGCVRVKDALGFAAGLAEQQGVAAQWQQARASGKEAYVPLPRPIPVRLLYWNAFVDPSGQVAFRTDPYGWNAPIAKALGFNGSATARPKPKDIDVGP